jgi:hypothetical protein
MLLLKGLHFLQSAKFNALWTPPRSKANKITKAAKKKQKLPKPKDLPQPDRMSVEELKRNRSISSPISITKIDSVDGETSPALSDGSQQGEHKRVAVPVCEGEHSGKIVVKEKRQSFSCGFQRSFSLDNMLSDEHELEHSEASGRTQVVISILWYVKL